MASNKHKSDFIDFKSIFKAYRKRWYWFVISLAVFGCLGYLYARKSNPEYQVKANIKIIDREANPLLASSEFQGLFGSGAKVDDEVFVVSSHSLLRDVVRQLKLNVQHYVHPRWLKTYLAYPKYPVTVTAPEGVADTLSRTVKFDIEVSPEMKVDGNVKIGDSFECELDEAPLPAAVSTPYGRFTIVATPDYPKGKEVKTEISYMSYAVASEALSKMLDISVATRKSNIIQLAMQTSNIKYGEAVLDEIIKDYNTLGLRDNSEQGQKTLEFIDERIKLLAGDLSSSESAIQTYKQQHGIIDVAVEAQYQTERRGAIDEKLVEAETAADVLRLTRDFMSNPSNKYSLVPITTDNQGLIAVITGYNDLLLRRMELQKSAKGNNANLQALTDQVDAMRSNISSSVQRAYDQAMVPVRELRAQMAKTQGKLGEVPRQEREFLDMKRQQEVKQQLYIFLLQRREETAMMIANAKAKAQVVDNAYSVSDPVTMGKMGRMLIFLILGGLLPLAGIYLLTVTRTKFDGRSEVERIVEMPILGEICTDKSGNSVVVGESDTSSSSELFRLLRTNLLFILNDTRDKVVLLTSTNPGEGKSYISINLAMTLSLLKKRVLLMGMDIRKPKLSQYLHIHSQFGITQYLSSDNITLDQLIVRDAKYPGLDIMVAGPIPPNPAELLASSKVEDMFDELRERYDYIIVDTAPVGMVSDTFTLDRVADATIYVCRANYTAKGDLQFADQIYRDHRLKKLSLVINGAQMRKSYGYGHYKA